MVTTTMYGDTVMTKFPSWLAVLTAGAMIVLSAAGCPISLEGKERCETRAHCLSGYECLDGRCAARVAGGGGGGGEDGGMGGGVGGPTGGGGSGGGGGAVDAGGGAGGGDGEWEFSSLALTPVPSGLGAIVGFAETDAGMYAVSGSGRLYRSTGGGPFRELFAFPGRNAIDFEASASGHFFVLAPAHFIECASDCADAGAWVDRQISAASDVLRFLCVVDDDHVLAIGWHGNWEVGISYRWDGAKLDLNPMSLSVSNPRNCWRGASGDFFIPASDTVLRYSPTSQSFTPEPISPIDSWRGGGSSPGHEWATGLGVIAERRATSWTNVFASAVSSTISTVVGISPTLAFAFGGAPSDQRQAGYYFDGTRWAPMTPDIPAVAEAQSAFRSSDGAVFVGGNGLDFRPVIVRGARRN